MVVCCVGGSSGCHRLAVVVGDGWQCSDGCCCGGGLR